MPHQCTECGHTFPDGSKQMLSGCPDCGGNKFQFLPSSAVGDDGSAGEAPSPGETSDPGMEAPAPETSEAGSRTDEDIIEPEPAPEIEDPAQASARNTVVSDDELPAKGGPGVAGGDAAVEEAEEPSLAELRAELNDQFESIKILEPGQYELNLMELYDREEYIVALEEDGRYAIEVPSSWREDEG